MSALLQEVQQDLIDEMLEDNIPESEALDDENVESVQRAIDIIWCEMKKENIGMIMHKKGVWEQENLSLQDASQMN